MNKGKLAFAALASLSVGLPTLALGSYVAKAGFQVLNCSAVKPTVGEPQGACRFPASVYLNAPVIHQSMRLDCESAALSVALAVKGIELSQNWVFDQLPKDTRAALVSRERPVTWGDPYTAFVGNVNGSENNYTGYGVYYPPIVAVAERAGAPAVGHTAWTTIQIESQIRRGNPVVVWVNFNFAYSGTSTWNAWDGRAIPYTTEEHTVTVIGFNTTARTVTVIDVGVGLRRTIPAAEFTSAIATFGGMAVAIS